MTRQSNSIPSQEGGSTEASPDRTERTATIIAAAGTATFVRAAGGRVLGITGGGRGDPEVEIENGGTFEGFDDIGFNTAYKGEAEIRCAMAAQVCTAMAGSAAIELADPVSTAGLHDTEAMGRSLDWEDALLAQFLPFAGINEEDEGVVCEEFAHFARNVVGKNWITVVDTANEVAHLGGIIGETVNGFRELQYPCPVTLASAGELFARAMERGDDWRNVGSEQEVVYDVPEARYPIPVRFATSEELLSGVTELEDYPGSWSGSPQHMNDDRRRQNGLIFGRRWRPQCPRPRH